MSFGQRFGVEEVGCDLECRHVRYRAFVDNLVKNRAIFRVGRIGDGTTCNKSYVCGDNITCEEVEHFVGFIRDVLLNNVPVIFHKEIYAMASVLGGCLFWLMNYLNVDMRISATITFIIIVAIRFLAVRYHLSLPILHLEQDKEK
mgnify:CR=1 FL=1